MFRRKKRKDEELDPLFVIAAYRAGYFPMAESRKGRILWYSPDPRAIIPLDTFHTSRSLRQRLRKGSFDIRTDTDFSSVIAACSEREDTWISDEIIRVYTALHTMGFAHSVEAWEGTSLVGGLYGVAIGGAFFGESMFSKTADASKVALVSLVQRLRERRFLLLDTQFMNEHLKQFGTAEIPREKYLHILSEALAVSTTFADPPPHM